MHKQKQAFTLVELIVVITILAILGTIAIMAFSGYSKNARDSARISDITNMKKSLELWILQSGTYPEPTNGVTVLYSGATVWTQGTFGNSVTQTVGKLEKKPIDPLYEVEYTYSVTTSKKEYQIGSVLEMYKEEAYISGNYNGILTTTQTGGTYYILAAPSIILSDITDVNLLGTKQFVMGGQGNLPASYMGKNLTMTGSDFDFEPVVVWSGSGYTNLNDQTEFQDLVINIQDAYKFNTILIDIPEYTYITNDGIPSNETMNYIKTIVETNTAQELNNISSTYTLSSVSGLCSGIPANAIYYNNLVLYSLVDAPAGTSLLANYNAFPQQNTCQYKCETSYSGTNCETYNPPVFFLENCTANGQIIYTDLDGIEIGRVNNDGTLLSGNPDLLTCSGHVMVCSGSNTGYVLQSCNLGSGIVGKLNESDSYGNYYQWGNNAGMTPTTPTSSAQVNASGYGPGNYYNNPTFIISWQSWSSVQNNNLWGSGGTVAQRQGPCPDNYHIPHQTEWNGVITAWGGGINGDNLSKSIKLPNAGYRKYSNGTMYSFIGRAGVYTSSKPNTATSIHSLFFSETSTMNSAYVMYRSEGLSLRCFKN